MPPTSQLQTENASFLAFFARTGGSPEPSKTKGRLAAASIVFLKADG
jgi:hypothetical protein